MEFQVGVLFYGNEICSKIVIRRLLKMFIWLVTVKNYLGTTKKETAKFATGLQGNTITTITPAMLLAVFDMESESTGSSPMF